MQPSNFSRRVREARVPTGAVAQFLASSSWSGVRKAASVAALLATGCVLTPEGLDAERAEVDRAGEPYAESFEERTLPELPLDATWRDLLERAFAANGELERAYFEWKSALERVAQAAGYPDTNLAPSFSYLLSGDGATAWDNTTVNIAFDPMRNLSLPSKVRTAGELALAEARTAGRRFVAAKFALQRQVLDAWLELALLEEQSRIQAERAELALFAAASAESRAQLSGDQRDLLRAHVDAPAARLELEGTLARARAARVALNGLLARDPDAPLGLPSALPEPRAVTDDDAALLAAGVGNDPELQGLGFAVEERERALELARLQYLPDFNPFFSFTGSVEQMLGVGVSLPTRLPQIRAGVAEARALLSGARAELRQATADRRAEFVGALTMLRFAERQVAFLGAEVEPALVELSAIDSQAYATGGAGFDALIESQRALLDVRGALAEARIERERRVAEIEQIIGVDLATLEPRDVRVAAAEEDRHE
ncbi:MAG: TolC family protein [Planctomycetes bacterium]|nr:TolC family protein [Planctomycetota bacterium]